MIERLKLRNEKSADRLDQESLDFHKKAYESYLKLIKNESKRFHVLDPNKDSKSIASEMLEIINKKRNEK
jgi:dTMP kinase